MKRNKYDMYTDYYKGSPYDINTTTEKQSDYDMYSDIESVCGEDHIHVGPLIFEVCRHGDQLHVCIYDEKDGELIAETEPSEHEMADHFDVLKENIEDIYKAYLSKQEISKSERPFHGYSEEKHSKTGGLNDKYREKVNRETGSDLKRPVTGKVKPGSKAAKRRKSFCARMSGVKGPTYKDGKLTPKGAALKRWKCRKSEDFGKSAKKLEHYSPHENLKEIDPKFKGTGVDARTNRAFTEHPHSFYYIAGSEPESIVTQRAKRKYIVELPQDARIYDLKEDPENFVQSVLKENQGIHNRDMLLGKIKSAGYHGFMHSGSALPNVVALFHSMPISESNEIRRS